MMCYMQGQLLVHHVYKLWSFQRKGIEIKSAGSGDRGLKREKSVVCEETRQIKCGGLDNSFHTIHTHTFQLPYPARCQEWEIASQRSVACLPLAAPVVTTTMAPYPYTVVLGRLKCAFPLLKPKLNDNTTCTFY